MKAKLRSADPYNKKYHQLIKQQIFQQKQKNAKQKPEEGSMLAPKSEPGPSANTEVAKTSLEEKVPVGHGFNKEDSVDSSDR